MPEVPFTLEEVGHFGLAVRDPKKSAKWFERTLGLRKEFDFNNGIAVGKGRGELGLDIGVERRAIHGAVHPTQGAVSPSHLSAAMKVCVPQRPNGAEARKRCPRRLRPRSRVILVLTAVSSMNTRRAG